MTSELQVPRVPTLEFTTGPTFDRANPPRRIFVGDLTYTLAAPRVPLPPLAQTAKIILNWIQTGTARIAKNVMYTLLNPPADPTNVAHLQTLANGVLSSWGTSGLPAQHSINWVLNSVTARDNSGTSAQATSTTAGIPGSATGAYVPPQSCVAISWQVLASYRGGKPRSYIPGVPNSALVTAGDSALTSVYAAATAASADLFIAHVNAIPTGGGTVTLGTLSHFHSHAVRPVPFFYAYTAAKVHERLDSQRRRSGKESAFPSVP